MDHKGTLFERQRLQGKWTFLFFGYTHCPDICPLALASLADLFTRLKTVPDALQKAQGVFVSVDPGRDNVELLNQYISYFNANFIAVTGHQVEIFNLTRQLGADYFIHPEEDEAGNYLVGHTADIFLLNPNGELQTRFKPDENTHMFNVENIMNAYVNRLNKETALLY